MSELLELNDELLCAYMDGELDPARRARVELALVDDAGARVRLARMRVADERLKAEIPLPALQPNDPLSVRILVGKPVPRAGRLRWGAAISALAAGIGGVVVGFVLSRSQEAPQAPVVASAPSTLLRGAVSSELLLATLEGSESGKVTAKRDRSVQVMLTFRTEDGRYCRAFHSRDASAAGEGVACRDGAQWQVVAWDGTADRSEGFRAAGSSELLDDVMDRLGGSPALESATERALIERHWTAPQQ